MGITNSLLCCLGNSKIDREYVKLLENKIREHEIIIGERDQDIKELEDILKAQNEYLTFSGTEQYKNTKI